MEDNKSVHTVVQKPYRKLGFTALEAGEMVEYLNRLVANCQVHNQKLRNFHWNVDGQDFFELHEVFENLYHKMDDHIDQLAERIRVFGHRPYSTLKQAIHLSEIKEPSSILTSIEMVREVIKDYDTILSLIIDAVNCAYNNGDAGSVFMLNKMTLDIETDFWKLNTWLKQDQYSEFKNN